MADLSSAAPVCVLQIDPSAEIANPGYQFKAVFNDRGIIIASGAVQHNTVRVLGIFMPIRLLPNPPGLLGLPGGSRCAKVVQAVQGTASHHRSRANFATNRSISTPSRNRPRTKFGMQPDRQGIFYEHDHQGNALAAMINAGKFEVRGHRDFSNERVKLILAKLAGLPGMAPLLGFALTYRNVSLGKLGNE